MSVARGALALAAAILLAPVAAARQVVPPTAASLLPKATPDAAAPFRELTDDAWPPRITLGGEAAMGVVRVIDPPPRAWAEFGVSASRRPNEADDTDVALLRALTGDPLDDVSFERAGGRLIQFDPPGAERRKTLSARDPVRAMVFSSLRPGAPPRIERTSFLVFEPSTDTRRAAPRGVALVLPGLMATPRGTVDRLVTRLQEDGWVVVRMLALSSRLLERISARFEPDGDADAQMLPIAREFDDRTAEVAYAAQGALADVERWRRELASLPRVVIGFSGGAIVLPTVVAREPEQYDRAVIVVGGANFWLSTVRSNYADMIRSSSFTWTGGPPDEAVLSRFSGSYLRHSRLDSFHTCACLRGKPVFMVHGAGDLAVPADLGEVLWKRIGEPERVVLSVGHELTVAAFPSLTDRILAFLRGDPIPEPAE